MTTLTTNRFHPHAHAHTLQAFEERTQNIHFLQLRYQRINLNMECECRNSLQGESAWQKIRALLFLFFGVDGSHDSSFISSDQKNPFPSRCCLLAPEHIFHHYTRRESFHSFTDPISRFNDYTEWGACLLFLLFKPF